MYRTRSLSFHPSLSSYLYLSIYQSINQSIYQSTDQSINQSINQSIRQSINPSIHINQSIFPSFYLFGFLSFLSFLLSFFLSLSLFPFPRSVDDKCMVLGFFVLFSTSILQDSSRSLFKVSRVRILSWRREDWLSQFCICLISLGNFSNLQRNALVYRARVFGCKDLRDHLHYLGRSCTAQSPRCAVEHGIPIGPLGYGRLCKAHTSQHYCHYSGASLQKALAKVPSQT